MGLEKDINLGIYSGPKEEALSRILMNSFKCVSLCNNKATLLLSLLSPKSLK